jgi:membrane protein DedA with SNARE-associated domain
MEEKRSYLGVSRREWLTLAIIVPIIVGIIIAAKPLVTDILNSILNLNPTLVYIVVFALVFAEASIFIGFIFPGETAVILGAVVASSGRVNIVALTVLVVIGAIAGDTVGYFVGKRYGEKVLELKILKHHRGGIDKALELLATRGSVAVFIGRFTAFLRAMMPGLAGLSRMHYQKFLIANAAGGVVWGVGCCMAGYLLGHAYHKAEKYAGWASTGILVLVLLVVVTLFVRGRVKEQRLEESVINPGESLEDEIEQARKRFND